MPVHNRFVIKNVIFDSIDSVLDQTQNELIKNCLNDMSMNCCSIDTSLQIIKCNDSLGNTLMPKFHMLVLSFFKNLLVSPLVTQSR
ncbi:hypothetical protein FGO68_gene4784 [Halteria grandinella]|uniref:Uncharacterized protein n=1 Tax=Halteria grandinella TaxID=5974 RepID=A0A8J8NH38_HALGN|nr:hypothetical protein FGO68_gene4784 [Halteria grandinella]